MPLAHPTDPLVAPHWHDRFLRAHLRPGLTVYEVGDEVLPIGAELKRRFGLRLIALDARRRLDRTPLGLYDAIICADLVSYQGVADADVVLWQGALGGGSDSDAVLASLARLLKPGAVALVQVQALSPKARRDACESAGRQGLAVIDQAQQAGLLPCWLRRLTFMNEARFTLALRKKVITALPVPQTESARGRAPAVRTTRFHWPALQTKG